MDVRSAFGRIDLRHVQHARNIRGGVAKLHATTAEYVKPGADDGGTGGFQQGDFVADDVEVVILSDDMIIGTQMIVASNGLRSMVIGQPRIELVDEDGESKDDGDDDDGDSDNAEGKENEEDCSEDEVIHGEEGRRSQQNRNDDSDIPVDNASALATSESPRTVRAAGGAGGERAPAARERGRAGRRGRRTVGPHSGDDGNVSTGSGTGSGSGQAAGRQQPRDTDEANNNNNSAAAVASNFVSSIFSSMRSPL
jgi:hypothetical protein